MAVIERVPVHPQKVEMAQLTHYTSMAYPRVYDVVTKLSYTTEIAENDMKELSFPSQEAKDRAMAWVKTEKKL